MISTYNRVSILGIVGFNPVLFKTHSGKSFCLLKIWTNETYIDSDGILQKKIEWHRITCWGSIADSSAKYLNKGRQILITGKLRNRSFIKDNINYQISEIVAEDIKYLGGIKKIENTIINIQESQDNVDIPI